MRQNDRFPGDFSDLVAHRSIHADAGHPYKVAPFSLEFFGCLACEFDPLGARIRRCRRDYGVDTERGVAFQLLFDLSGRWLDHAETTSGGEPADDAGEDLARVDDEPVTANSGPVGAAQNHDQFRVFFLHQLVDFALHDRENLLMGQEH